MAWAGRRRPGRPARRPAPADGRTARASCRLARGGRARAPPDVAWPDLPHGMSAGNIEAGTVTKRGWHRRDKCNYRKRSVNKRTSWAPRIPASRARLLACANRAGRVPIRAGRQGLACAARMRNVKNNRLSAPARGCNATMPASMGPTPRRSPPCPLPPLPRRRASRPPCRGSWCWPARHRWPGPGRAPCAGVVPAAGQHGPGLVARDLRHGHGAAEPDLGVAQPFTGMIADRHGSANRRRAGFLCGRTDRHDARGHAGDVRADGGDLRRHRPVRHRLRRHLRRVEPAGRARAAQLGAGRGRRGRRTGAVHAGAGGAGADQRRGLDAGAGGVRRGAGRGLAAGADPGKRGAPRPASACRSATSRWGRATEAPAGAASGC